jgi:hypothetical protein
MGFYQALIEARIPFEMVHDRLLDAAHTDQFRTLILPNIAALSDEQCEQLRQFVKRGGSLVATYETSLYDEWGVRRRDFGLSELFGLSVTGPAEGPMKNSYLNIEKDQRTGAYHPLLAGLEDAGRIINGVHRIPAEPREKDAYAPLRLIPSYPDLPMEKVFPRVPKTDIPGVTARQVGQGRVVFFPWDIDRTYWEVLSTDHGKLLRNAVMWATNEEPVVRVQGPGLIEVTVWAQKQSLTVHLVNLSNPMMMKGPLREVIPIGAQKVRLRLPSGKLAGVRLLVGGGQADFSEAAGVVEVQVPSINLHEVVAVDLM